MRFASRGNRRSGKNFCTAVRPFQTVFLPAIIKKTYFFLSKSEK